MTKSGFVRRLEYQGSQGGERGAGKTCPRGGSAAWNPQRTICVIIGLRRSPRVLCTERSRFVALNEEMTRWDPFYFVCCCCWQSVRSCSGEDLTVLKERPEGIPPGKQWEVYLKQQFYRFVDRRLEKYEKVKSRADCALWQKERREFFVEQLGGFPDRTPLDAQTVGRLEGKGYRVEKVIFESRPQHRVTANLYLPLTEPPYPGVLVPCGHSHNGKAAGQYQRISILLAKHGIAALCYDPISQGERYQMLDHQQEHTHFATATG